MSEGIATDNTLERAMEWAESAIIDQGMAPFDVTRLERRFAKALADEVIRLRNSNEQTRQFWIEDLTASRQRVADLERDMKAMERVIEAAIERHDDCPLCEKGKLSGMGPCRFGRTLSSLPAKEAK